MVSVALLERGRRALLVTVRGDQGGVHVDDHPPGQKFPGHAQPRKPLRPAGEQLPHPGPDPRPGFRDPAQGCLVQLGQSPAHSRFRRRIRENEGLMREQPDVGHAGRAEHDRGRQTGQYRAPIPPPRPATAWQHRVQRTRQTGPIRALPHQNRARVPDQTPTAHGHLQPRSPSRTLTHRKGAPFSTVDMI